MKIATNAATLDRGDSREVRKARIVDSPVIMNILSRQLYNKPIEALIREIVINAIDAHTECESEIPVEVLIPENDQEIFYVRDFGAGLDHETLMDIYLTYGESTRRDTNDVHGGWGLGTKSPLAYVDMFSVFAYDDDDTRREYLIYYDEDGVPNVDYRGRTPCTGNDVGSGTGLKVALTIKAMADVFNFQQAARKVFRYIPHGLLDVHCKIYNVLEHSIDELAEPHFHTNGFSFTQAEKDSSGSLSVKMGYVVYPVDLTMLLDMCVSLTVLDVSADPIKVLEYIQRELTARLEVPIGTFDIHPSRESILLTKTTARSIVRHVVQGIDTYIQTDGSIDVVRDSMLSELNLPEFENLYEDVRVHATKFSRQYANQKCLSGGFKKAEFFSGYGDLLRTVKSANAYVWIVAGDQYTNVCNIIAGLEWNSTIVPLKYMDRSSGKCGGAAENYLQDIVVVHGHLSNSEVSDAMRKGCNQIVVEDIDDWVERQLENMNLGGSGVSYAVKEDRTPPIRSIQDPAHNILFFDPSTELNNSYAPPYSKAYKCHRRGRKKSHWNSSMESVSSLKEMGRPVYVVNTRMGCIPEDQGDEFHQLTLALHTYSLITPDKSKVPIIVGLPASRGTKRFEAAFPGMDRLKVDMVGLMKSDSTARRLMLIATHYKFRNLLDTMETLRAYGPADEVYRILEGSRRLGKPLLHALNGSMRVVVTQAGRYGIREYPLSGSLVHLAARFPVLTNLINSIYEHRYHADIVREGVKFSEELARCTSLHTHRGLTQ